LVANPSSVTLRFIPFLILGSLLWTLIHRFWRTAILCVYVEDRIAFSKNQVPVAHPKLRLPDLNHYAERQRRSISFHACGIFSPFRSYSSYLFQVQFSDTQSPSRVLAVGESYRPGTDYIAQVLCYSELNLSSQLNKFHTSQQYKYSHKLNTIYYKVI